MDLRFIHNKWEAYKLHLRKQMSVNSESKYETFHPSNVFDNAFCEMMTICFEGLMEFTIVQIIHSSNQQFTRLTTTSQQHWQSGVAMMTCVDAVMINSGTASDAYVVLATARISVCLRMNKTINQNQSRYRWFIARNPTALAMLHNWTKPLIYG